MPKQQKFIFPQFWRRESNTKLLASSSPGQGYSWLADSHLLPVSLWGFFSVSSHEERKGFLISHPLLKDASLMGLGPHIYDLT